MMKFIVLDNSGGLLDCPFCGCNEVGVASDDDGWAYIECRDCYCRTDGFRSPTLMRNVWNTRNGHLYTAEDYKQDALEREHGL